MPPVAEGFDVKAAKNAGYSDDEILQHLTETRKFDIDGAVKAGYTKQEIIDHLSSSPTQIAQSSGQPKTQTVFGKEAPASDPTQPIYPLRETILNGARHAEDSLNAVGRFLSHPIDNILVPATKFIASEGQVAPDENGQYRINQDPLSKTLGTIGRNTGAVVAPGSVNPATEQQNTEASEFAGENLAGTLAGAVTHKTIQAVSPLGLEPSAKAKNTALFTENEPHLFEKSINDLAKVVGATQSRTAFRQFAEDANVGMAELKKTAEELLPGKAITDNASVEHVATPTTNRLFDKIAAPINAVKPVSVEPIARAIESRIQVAGRQQANPVGSGQAPDTVLTAKEAAKMQRFVNDNFKDPATGKYLQMDGPELQKLLKKLNSADKINSIMNGYDAAAAQTQVSGYQLHETTNAVRKFLIDQVKSVTGQDITQGLSDYGHTTGFLQQMGQIPIDPSVWDILEGHSYVTGTKPNFLGRGIQAGTAIFGSPDRKIASAFKNYNGPVYAKGQEPVVQEPASSFVRPSGSAFGNFPSKYTFTVPDTLHVMPESSNSTLNRPVNPTESVIPYDKTRTSSMVLSKDTPLNLQPKVFKFSIRGKLPDLVMQGAAGETPAKLALTGNPPPGSDPRLPSHYAQNWQLDSQTHGQPLTETYQGPGTLSTTDPKVVENTVASIQRYIEKNRPYGARLAELKQTQQDLLNQLRKYKAQGK